MAAHGSPAVWVGCLRGDLAEDELWHVMSRYSEHAAWVLPSVAAHSFGLTIGLVSAGLSAALERCRASR